jgi:hypothetical protein
MANEYARNIQDASLNPATFALPTTLLAAGSKQSAAIDLGTDTFKPEEVELELSIPALSSTIAPAGSTGGVTYAIESGTTSTFTTASRTIVSKTIAGSASGVAATLVRCRVPSDCEQYVRARVTLATTCTDASAVAGTLTIRF